MKTLKTQERGVLESCETRTLNILQTTMINYSIVMRSVNANLLEINQAKKEGKTNVDLNAPTTPDNTPGGSTPSGGSSTTEGGSGNIEYRKKIQNA